jgi:hypothetical protein
MSDSTRIETLRRLKPGTRSALRRRLTEDEIREAMAAVQRGVPVGEVGNALGIPPTSRGILYTAVGAWALRRCRCLVKP